MNETFLKTFLRMGVMIALRIPLRLIGAWLLTKGYVESAEWEMFATGAGLIAVDLVWWAIEQRGVLKAFAQKDAVIHQQGARIMQQIVALQEQKEIAQIALDLPKGASLDDALQIHQQAKNEEPL